MGKKLISLLVLFIASFNIITVCCTPETSAKNKLITGNNGELFIKPYRVLVVIGDQWTDSMSYNIDTRRVKGKEFIDVVTMLKIWGVPFDILRLDQQRLQINRFLDGEAKPNYGCIIWMADPDKLEGYSANFKTLKKAIEEYGISMIALFDNIKTKQIADLIGIDYRGIINIKQQVNNKKLIISNSHYITSEASGTILPDDKQTAAPSIVGDNGITLAKNMINESRNGFDIVNCIGSYSIKVLGKVGEFPQITVRDISNNTKVIWIGGGKDWFRKYSIMRRIFRKSLIYAIGYGVFNDNFENGFIFIMDDIGCSEHAWSLRWHYPTPSKETLLKYLIEPLEKRGLMMVQNITPGFANPKTHIIEVPWTQKPFKDIYGNWQDYRSTKEGLIEGLKRGVFEIQAHRAWSHMNWDLDSSPGPWWGSPIDGEMAKTDWYNEIVDVRRGGISVPFNDLLFIYKTGIDAIKKAFGVVPLSAEVRTGAEVREGTPGGDDNGRVAAIAGIGVSRECYVGFDRTIEFSMMMPEQFTCHDLDLTPKTGSPSDTDEAHWDNLLKLSTEQLMSSKIAGGRRINLLDNTKWIDDHADKHWMGFNECCAYLHTDITSFTVNKGLKMKFDYDDHYCKFFEEKTSQWTFECSDEFKKRLGEGESVQIDGKTISKELNNKDKFEIPAGLGSHFVEINNGK